MAYWRLMEKTDTLVAEQLAEVPEMLRPSMEDELRQAAYPEEWATWRRGLDRLMELYGVPEAPDGHQTHTDARETALGGEVALPDTYTQVGLF